MVIVDGHGAIIDGGTSTPLTLMNVFLQFKDDVSRCIRILTLLGGFMDIHFDSAAFGIGCAGALAHESLRWISLRTEDKMPAYLAKIHYWILTALLVLVGGALASILSPISIVQALFFGIAAPAILSRIGTLTPTIETLGPGDAPTKDLSATHTSLQDFLRG